MSALFENEKTAAERARLEGMLRVQRIGHEYRLAVLGPEVTSNKIPPSILSEMFATQDPSKEFESLLAYTTDPARSERFTKVFRGNPPALPAPKGFVNSYSRQESYDNYLRLERKNRQLYDTVSTQHIAQQASIAAKKNVLEPLLRFYAHQEHFTIYLYLVVKPDSYPKFWQDLAERRKILAAVEYTHERMLRLIKTP